jgi:hypothetical protein
MPSRQEREQLARTNLHQALRDAKIEIVIESLERVGDGYRVLFRKGPLTHSESGIDEGKLEDGPATDKIRRLVQKVKLAFGGNP